MLIIYSRKLLEQPTLELNLALNKYKKKNQGAGECRLFTDPVYSPHHPQPCCELGLGGFAGFGGALLCFGGLYSNLGSLGMLPHSEQGGLSMNRGTSSSGDDWEFLGDPQIPPRGSWGAVLQHPRLI